MGSFIKKNWFVSLLVVVFAVVCVYYIYDTNKGKLKGKTSNGEDVVYEINGEDVTTTAFYDSLYKSTGSSALAQAFQKAVLEQSMDTTNTMKENAAAQAANVISSYQSNYPTTYSEELDASLKQMGYSGKEDLENYLIDYYKELEIIGQYCEDHFDDLTIRDVSYILIQFEDGDSGEGTPTEDEQSRMDAVDAAFDEGKTFAEVAETYSEDSSTASDGGYLGIVDANTTSLDSAFLEGCLSLEEGETSDWVYSSNFGYFKIYCNASTPTGLKDAYMAREKASAEAEAAASATASPTASAEATATAEAVEVTVEEPSIGELYYDLYANYDTELTAKAIYAKAEELGITYEDETLEAKIKTALGLSE